MFLLLLLTDLACATGFGAYYEKYGEFLRANGIGRAESYRAYVENENAVRQHNSLHRSYNLSMTGPYAGVSRARFMAMFSHRFNRTQYHHEERQRRNRGYLEPVDYRDQMSPVRDQGGCASCYSFGSVGALEGRLNVDRGVKLDLSEQQVVSCSQSYGNKGCSGGLSYYVYQYIMDNDLAYEVDYPYTGSTSTCKSTTKHVRLTRFQSCRGAMQECVLRGPVDIAMDVTSSFQLYSSGYYDETSCYSDPDLLNHEMVAVGYGYNNGRLYYIIRNSWGASWGLSGYAYVYEGVCGVDADPVEPLEYTLF